jgi:hypothetical protein
MSFTDVSLFRLAGSPRIVPPQKPVKAEGLEGIGLTGGQKGHLIAQILRKYEKMHKI